MPEMSLDELARKGEAALAEASKKLGDALGERVPVEHDRLMKAVDDAFDAVEVMVKNQRAFAHTVIDSVFAPLAPPPKKPAPKKPAAKKPSAKTAKVPRKTATRKRAAKKVAAS